MCVLSFSDRGKIEIEIGGQTDGQRYIDPSTSPVTHSKISLRLSTTAQGTNEVQKIILNI